MYTAITWTFYTMDVAVKWTSLLRSSYSVTLLAVFSSVHAVEVVRGNLIGE